MRTAGRKVLYCVALVIAGAFAAPRTAAQAGPSFVGYVYEFKGSWRIGPQYAADITIGQGIRNHESVKLNSFDSRAYIRIGMIDKQIIQKSCAVETDKCRESFDVGIDTPPDTLSSRLLNIWNHLTAPPEKSMVFTLSRGASVDPPDDAVIPLKLGKPDFASALEHQDPGELDVSLEPLGRTKGTNVALKVDWQSPQAKVSGPNVRPGLYILRLSPNSRPATVLIAESAKADKLKADFVEAQRLCNGWPPEMSHPFLASVLAELYGGTQSGR